MPLVPTVFQRLALLALTFAVTAHGLTVAERQRIEALKAAPAGIAEVIRLEPTSNVGKFFTLATTVPERFKYYLGREDQPEAFRHYLLTELSSILRTGDLRHEGATFEQYLQALFATFRDKQPSSKVRQRAYFLWKELVPLLGADSRQAALSSLRNRIQQPDQRVDAIPALLLGESDERRAALLWDGGVADTQPRYRVLTDTNAEVRFRAMEVMNLAILRESPTGRLREMQLAVVPFLRDSDARVRDHAQRFLADITIVKGRIRGLLKPQTTAALVAILTDGTVAVDSRITALRVIAGDLFVDWFDTTPKLQLVPVYEAVSALLASPEVRLRQAAAGTLASLKPFDTNTILALVDAAFGLDPTVSSFAFTALGASERKDRIRFLPNGGPRAVMDRILERFEAAIADRRRDADGSRRRDASELISRNVPTDGATLARIAAIVLSYQIPPAPTQAGAVDPHAADRHARNTLLSTLALKFPDEVAYSGYADPHQSLVSLLRTAAAMTDADRTTVEPMILGLRPTEPVLLDALAAATGAARRLLVRQIAGYSDGRLQRLTRARNADARLAACFDDPELARILLAAFAEKRSRVTLRNTPELLLRVLAAAEVEDTTAPAGTAPMHESAALILEEMGNIRGRHLAFGNTAAYRPHRIRLLVLAQNEAAPAASREAAQALREFLQARRNGVARCAEELAAGLEEGEE